MFREMRRGKQLLSKEDTAAVMDRGTNEILACLGDEDYPYAVPLSYVLHNEKYIFTRQKPDTISMRSQRIPRFFTVVDKDT
jgi:nitroimidazol reductase NimA-like FMN-containing flavoprotein (pyridoxamine 5'-phosphate oxidase superfamily)